MNKVAITGFGLVSTLGCDVDGAVAALRNGEAATGGAAGGLEAETGQPRRVPLRDFKPADYVDKKKVRRMDPVNTFVIAAARMALEAAGIEGADREDCGIVVGTGFAGFSSVVKHQQKFLSDGIAQLSPAHFPTTVYNASAGLAAIELGMRGVNSTVTGLDVGGDYALLYGCMLLRNGMARRLVVVGADELCPALLEGFRDLGFASRGERDPLPYDRRRDGFLAAEGAGALVLELEKTARGRGAPIWGLLEGTGVASAGDKAYGYHADPGAPGAALRQALYRAGLSLEDVDWVSASANATRDLDRAEAAALGPLLGDRVAVALKTFTGDYAGSGPMRLGLGLACARAGFVPAMPEGDYEPAIAPRLNRDRDRQSGGRFLHHAMGLGGNNLAFVVARGD